MANPVIYWADLERGKIQYTRRIHGPGSNVFVTLDGQRLIGPTNLFESFDEASQFLLEYYQHEARSAKKRFTQVQRLKNRVKSQIAQRRAREGR